MKKILFAILALLLALTGCAGARSADLPESRYEIDPTRAMYTDDVDNGSEITWFYQLDWYDPNHWGNDLVSQQIESDTGISVQVLIGTEEQLNSMIAAGTTPDLVTIDTGSNLNENPEEWAFSLDDLSAAYSPYFMSDLALPEYIDYWKQDDGKTYGYTSFAYSEKFGDYIESNTAFYVRKDIYEAIGEPDMTTPEGFMSALKAAKEYMPTDSNGSDLTAFGFSPGDVSTGNIGAIGETLQNWLGVPYVTEDGGVYDRYLDEDYLEWMETLSEAFGNGLMSEESFTLGQEDINAKIENGNYFAYLSSNAGNDSEHLKIHKNANPDEEYIVVDGFNATSGREHVFPIGSYNGWLITYVSQDAKNPQAAFNMLEYLITDEGYLTTTCGIEGKTYTWNEETQQCDATQWFIDNMAESDPDVNVGTGYIYATQPDAIWTALLNTGEEESDVAKFGEPYTTGPVLMYTDTDPDSGSNEGRNWQTFQIKRGEIFAKLVYNGDIDSALANYDEVKETYDLDAINDIRVQKYEENLEKFGEDE